MKTTDLPLAIEALGYDAESVDINKQVKYHKDILRNTFSSKLKHIEGVGSKFEGLTRAGYRMAYETTIEQNSDVDFVANFSELTISVYSMSNMDAPLVKKKINAVNDLMIEPCQHFPGYVYLKLLQPISGLDYIPNNVLDDATHLCSEERYVKITRNGPAFSVYTKCDGHPLIFKFDKVRCLKYKSWPVEASKWTSRSKPNNWPCEELIEKVKSKGFTLAPIGHHDCSKKSLQWRIGIRGETKLLRHLNETQMLCYVALRLILKGDIQLMHEDALSSFHMKNIIFWCAEQESCHWTKENFNICLKTCLNKLITFIMCENFPHYFLEDRNLINSKMTFELKKQIVKALTKYRSDILAILSLKSFDKLKKDTNFKLELLELAKQKSIILSCISFYTTPFATLYYEPKYLWMSYEGHNTEINLQNAHRILSFLEDRKRHFLLPYIAYAKNMLGLLYYSRYNKTRCKNDTFKSGQLLKSSLSFEHVSMKLRVATFYFMEHEFDHCLHVCSAILINYKKYKKLKHEKLNHLQTVLNDILTLSDTSIDVNKLTELKKKILAIFYDKCISDECGDGRILQAETVLSEIRHFRKTGGGDDNELTRYENSIIFEICLDGTFNEAILLLFKNFTNLVFRDMSFNVPYLAAEKWAVPLVIQYELLSIKRCHDILCGIYLDPMLNSLVLHFLCYHETKNLKQKEEILTKMEIYINEYPRLTESDEGVPTELPHSLPLYRVYNIVAYCCVKAGHYKMALSYILKSFELNENEENSAYGYVRCLRLYVKEYIVYPKMAIQDVRGVCM